MIHCTPDTADYSDALPVIHFFSQRPHIPYDDRWKGGFMFPSPRLYSYCGLAPIMSPFEFLQDDRSGYRQQCCVFESARSWVYRNTLDSQLPLIMTNVKKTVRTIKLQKRRLRSMVCKNWNLKKKTKLSTTIKKLWIKPQNTLNYGSCCNKPQFSQQLETKNKTQLLCSCDYCKQILTKHWQIELV